MVLFWQILSLWSGVLVAALEQGVTCEVVPVQPWATEWTEEKSCIKNKFRTPILPPLREGSPRECEGPPDEAEVLRALPRVSKGIEGVYKESRGDIRIVTEKLVDRIDPPRFFPLVGPAQLHHCHWKCTISCTDTIESAYPFPVCSRSPRVEVVYIDKDHLHLVTDPLPETQRSLSEGSN
ncbi:unnamed protein product [uncultured bacterium]|nr:unnamed protein product [uncultured bacterium]